MVLQSNSCRVLYKRKQLHILVVRLVRKKDESGKTDDSTFGIILGDVIIRALITRTLPFARSVSSMKLHILPLVALSQPWYTCKCRVQICDNCSTFCDNFCDKHAGFTSDLWQCTHWFGCHKHILHSYDSSLLVYLHIIFIFSQIYLLSEKCPKTFKTVLVPTCVSK